MSSHVGVTNILGYISQASADPNLLLVGVLLPFLLIFVILWGVLNMARIFGNTPEARKINIVISVVITLFAAFTDAWGILVTQLAAFHGIFVFILFFAVFIIGAIMWAIGRTRNVYDEHSGGGRQSLNSVKQIDKELKKQWKKYREAEYKGNKDMMQEHANNIDALQKKKDFVIKREMNK